jgi:hypothetical protein
MKHKIRVFISYSTEDKDIVHRLEETLKENNLEPLWMEKFSGGSGFDEQIRIFIEHAHIFMPVISESSSARGWVHQEIGYAMAQHIAVFPVIIGNVTPGGMLQFMHGIKLSDDQSILKEQVSYRTLSALLESEVRPALYQRAAKVEDRACLIKSYADKVRRMDKYGVVRQKGGLSSFHIPNKHIEHQVWTDRYVPVTQSPYHKEMQLGERKALQQHADKDGCRLIINPLYAFEGRSALAARTRIKTIIEFLESATNDKVVIAIQAGKTRIESLTIVGDWFLAESVSFKDGDGFTNTFLTRNASEISKRIETFDEELDDLLEQQGWTKENSKVKAIEELNRILTTIKD